MEPEQLKNSGVFCDLFFPCLGSLFNEKIYYFLEYRAFQTFLGSFSGKEDNYEG
jgi:hypothetical protein